MPVGKKMISLKPVVRDYGTVGTSFPCQENAWQATFQAKKLAFQGNSPFCHL
jgi:hypothetical protein